MDGRTETIFIEYAKDVSDSDNINVINDYSGAGIAEFECSVPAGAYRLVIKRLVVYIEDSGVHTASTYGQLSALTNGIEVFYEKDGTEMDLTSGKPIKKNGEWSRMNYDADLKTWGSGNSMIVARWTFEKALPITLRGTDRIVVKVNDNLVGLIDHTFSFQGFSDTDDN